MCVHISYYISFTSSFFSYNSHHLLEIFSSSYSSNRPPISSTSAINDVSSPPHILIYIPNPSSLHLLDHLLIFCISSSQHVPCPRLLSSSPICSSSLHTIEITSSHYYLDLPNTLSSSFRKMDCIKQCSRSAATKIIGNASTIIIRKYVCT